MNIKIHFFYLFIKVWLNLMQLTDGFYRFILNLIYFYFLYYYINFVLKRIVYTRIKKHYSGHKKCFYVGYSAVAIHSVFKNIISEIWYNEIGHWAKKQLYVLYACSGGDKYIVVTQQLSGFSQVVFSEIKFLNIFPLFSGWLSLQEKKMKIVGKV